MTRKGGGSILRRGACALALGLLPLLAREARAADLKSGIGVALTGFGGISSIDQDLHGGSQEPDLLASRTPRLEGQLGFGGAGLRIVAVLDRWRFTFEEGVFGLGGAKYRLDGAPLPAGFSTDAGSAWGAHFEVSAGRQLDVGPVSPYGEVRLGTALSIVDVNLRSTSYGRLGTTGYATFHLLVAPRVGAIYRLGRIGFVDVGASYDVTGVERFGLSLALGVWLEGPHYGPRRPIGWHL